MFNATLPSELFADLSTVASAQVQTAISSDLDLQRANGAGRAVLRGSEEGNRIVDVFQSSPIRIMFPRGRASAIEEAVFVNTSRCSAGAARLPYAVRARAGATLAM